MKYYSKIDSSKTVYKFMSLTSLFCQNMHHFFPIEKNPRVAIAVSGGADSLALVLLMYSWNKTVKGDITVLTVNHNLRSESVDEAKYVGNVCKSFKLRHVILEWQHNGVRSNIQARARQARYQLLTEYCQQNDILHLVCGHHADDLVENFFIRLLRGSGIAGLSSHGVFFLNNVRIIRPLLNIAKHELQKYLTSKNIQWVVDPSNSCSKYLRSEIRSLLQSLSLVSKHHKLSSELIRGRILLSQSHINRALQSINNEILHCMAHAVNISPAGFAKINQEILFQSSTETRYAILSHLLMMIGTNILPPRFASLELLIHQLDSNSSSYTCTLHGCVIQSLDKEIIIYKELGRHRTAPQLLQHGILWDSRFRVICNNHLLMNKNFTIDHLTEDEYKLIKLDVQNLQKINQYYRKNILFTFPVVKHLEKVVAIPHIDHYNNVLAKKSVSFIFEPQLTSHWFHFG